MGAFKNPITMDMIRDAEKRLKGHIDYTPIITARRISPNIFFKAENLQKTGAFKIRGAFNKIYSLTDEEAAKGVITCSAGNHAQGVALAASKRGIKSVVCMPSDAPIVKIEATRAYGAEVILVDGNFDDAQEEAEKLAKEKGYVMVHPFKDPLVIAGQATVGLEILEQMPDVEQIIVPIGGGGLFSGVATVVKELKPSCRVIGVQAAEIASMYGSVKLKEITKVADAPTIADGLHVLKPGDITYQITKELEDKMVTVTEDEICQAMLTIAGGQKMVTEGAGAASAAAFLFDKVNTDRKTVAVITGGNVDLANFTNIIQRAGFCTGRLAYLALQIRDNSKELAKVIQIIADCGARILSVENYQDVKNRIVDSEIVGLKIETLGYDHLKQIKDTLLSKGYTFGADTKMKED